jgi:uncharacterized membrane protein YfcA
MHVESAPALRLGLLFGAALWAGAQNQLAGGGSFITLPALILTGMDARAANITSTVALFPGQLTGGWMARRLVSGAGRLSFRALVVISLIGGAAGSVLLLLTPTSFFDQLVPWLVLFATAAFAWGSFGRRPTAGSAPVAPWAAGLIQFGIAIYGGYFGGGIGFLMMAALSLAGVAVHSAGATKNVLAGMMNASAVLVFVLSGEVRWLAAAVAGIGAMLGSVIGARMMLRVNERTLRAVVIVIGVILTVGMFARSRQQAAPTHAPTTISVRTNHSQARLAWLTRLPSRGWIAESRLLQEASSTPLSRRFIPPLPIPSEPPSIRSALFVAWFRSARTRSILG